VLPLRVLSPRRKNGLRGRGGHRKFEARYAVADYHQSSSTMLREPPPTPPGAPRSRAKYERHPSSSRAREWSGNRGDHSERASATRSNGGHARSGSGNRLEALGRRAAMPTRAVHRRGRVSTPQAADLDQHRRMSKPSTRKPLETARGPGFERVIDGNGSAERAARRHRENRRVSAFDTFGLRESSE